MTIENDIKSILVKEGYNVASFAEKIGTSRQNLGRKLKQETITYKEILNFAEILDYNVEWVKK